MPMKFALLGGDERSLLLAVCLSKAGHKVHSFALEKGELPPEVPKAGCIQSCVYGADCVILPLPAVKEGRLNAPFAAAPPPAPEELLPVLWPGQSLIGGKLPPSFTLEAMRQGIFVHDLLQCPELAYGNAVLTAESALAPLILGSKRSLWRSSCLICGWGRLAKLLALRLLALGADVTVAARSVSDRAMAQAMGMKALAFDRLPPVLGSFDHVINTVPAQVLGAAELSLLRSGALLLELASAPGGFDREALNSLGMEPVSAQGLPGRCCPQTAAELMCQTILSIMEDKEE